MRLHALTDYVLLSVYSLDEALDSTDTILFRSCLYFTLILYLFGV